VLAPIACGSIRGVDEVGLPGVSDVLLLYCGFVSSRLRAFRGAFKAVVEVLVDPTSCVAFQLRKLFIYSVLTISESIMERYYVRDYGNDITELV